LDLQAKGKLKESREMLRAAIPELRASGDQRSLARALSISGRIAVSLGDYPGAIQDASAAMEVRRTLKDDTTIGEDLTTLGLANLHLGNYDEALSHYEKALELDRAHHDGEGEVVRENDIGNVYFFHGRYSDALRAYQQALDKVNATKGESWIPWCRQLTLANLASLYQRLGKEGPALELYQQLAGLGQAMPRTEYAQLLLNEGVLYRRMGDPLKALEQYRASQAVFAAAHHRDGEIGALRNIGIARAIDLDDLTGALEAFTSALELARQSSDARGIVQAGLYRGEVLRRLLHRLSGAEDDFRMALEGAEKTGLAEERWKALYGLGRTAEAGGRVDAASDYYRKAIAGIESVRAGVRQTSLRSEFLADKRDVYDSLIALSVRQSPPPLDAIFSWMESSRARTFQERTRAMPTASQQTLREVQARLRPDSVLLDYWVGSEASAVLWIGSSGAGIVRLNATLGHLQDAVSQLRQSIQGGGDGWRELSRSLGALLMGGVPAAKHLIVAPDGPLGTLPFELLTDPASGALLIEKLDVSYLPAARFLAENTARRNWLPPWRTQMLAFGNPPVSSGDTLAAVEAWQPIPSSADEVKGIARLLPGRSEVHLGVDARKHDLLVHSPGVSLLHFSTHAIVDPENPDRSRILMAPDSAAAPFDYIFQQEVYGLDLRGVDLVTVSACDTARGKMIRGDGVQAFSQAFLAAGAAATVTSLWRVEDRPTADFMQQMYYFLAQGQSKSEALRSAKLQFLHSPSSSHDPRYWAAFVLNGDGWDACVRVIPWSYILCAGAVLLLLAWLWGRSPRPAQLRAKASSALQ
jgi:CHAT domain-containing protein/tetratricopeptide (TPR) repeat protein